MPANSSADVGARMGGEGRPAADGFPPTPAFTGDFDEMSLLAGESVGQTKTLKQAADIVREMMAGAAAIISGRLAEVAR
jgi:hypothetical protein